MRININKTDRSSIIKPPKIYQYFHPQISHGNPTSCIERSDLSSHVRCKNPAVGDDNPTDIRCPRANFAGLSTVGKIPVSLVPDPLQPPDPLAVRKCQTLLLSLLPLGSDLTVLFTTVLLVPDPLVLPAARRTAAAASTDITITIFISPFISNPFHMNASGTCLPTITSPGL